MSSALALNVDSVFNRTMELAVFGAHISRFPLPEILDDDDGDLTPDESEQMFIDFVFDSDDEENA
jgi:hypothetical protein